MTHKNKYPELGLLIKETRLKKEIDHKYVAAFVGLTPATYLRMEGGGGPPSLETFMRLSIILNLNLYTIQQLMVGGWLKAHMNVMESIDNKVMETVSREWDK